MIETYTRYCKFALLKPYCLHAKEGDFVEVVEWFNGEGFDVQISNVKHMSFTWGEWDCIQVLLAYREDKENASS